MSFEKIYDILRKICNLYSDINNEIVYFQKGYTALHLASKKRKTNIVNLLGSLGADCNVENEVIIAPAHEIMAPFVLRKFILQTRIRSHPVGLDV